MKAIGRAEFKRYKKGKRLTRGQAIKAKCFECTGHYDDGKMDCLVAGCPLYGYTPYLGKEPKPNKEQGPEDV